MSQRRGMANFVAGGIYGITDDALSRGRSSVEVVRLLLAAGVRVIQYREKAKPARVMYEECLAIRGLTADTGATFIVNDHVDLAMAVGADGVHVGQDDLPPVKVRELVGSDMAIGLSTHSPEQAREADKLAGVIDYIGVGPVYATDTKKDASAPVGLALLEYAAANVNLPYVAIGGIKQSNIAEVSRRGPGMIAIVSDIVGADDIVAKVAALRAAMA
ncbi:thiamine phosphate synthase [Anaeroselena agilis]|uniref:Thiamine-phosphate synthase n=1 Tax=Anaeroselena agilis TaxID=3063788 RepID=A0ABU3NYP9_9FIRM|nr:thiamine phosphate synthase [Selenomonadales bacterium 4137-cl]